MQRFMILIQGGFAPLEGLPPEALQAHLHKWHAWTQHLIERGHYLAGDGLRNAGRRLEARAGEVTVTEGPFAESTELLGGFYILQCRDLDEATALAHQSPNFEFGGRVEVRPFLEFVPDNQTAF
ncbi:MAG: YciI family protein [Bacteroidia bacterium]|nr:YciI family protein [Bacteroidia bacterium]